MAVLMLFSQRSSISIVIIAAVIKILQIKNPLKMQIINLFCNLNTVHESLELQCISEDMSPGLCVEL